jgi:hypothetical protein
MCCKNIIDFEFSAGKSDQSLKRENQTFRFENRRAPVYLRPIYFFVVSIRIDKYFRWSKNVVKYTQIKINAENDFKNLRHGQV